MYVQWCCCCYCFCSGLTGELTILGISAMSGTPALLGSPVVPVTPAMYGVSVVLVTPSSACTDRHVVENEFKVDDIVSLPMNMVYRALLI